MGERTLRRADLDSDPIRQFRLWFREAEQLAIPLAEGVALATVDAEGRPNCRVVLIKEVRDEGFVFFTNYESTKGEEIASNDRVALTFWWTALERQVRIRGRASKTSDEVSDEYFASRPRGSRISACVSQQSQPVESREALEREKNQLTRELEGRDVPRPRNWGGYLVRPQQIEFWQGREDRLHDRFLYDRSEGSWTIERLAP